MQEVQIEPVGGEELKAPLAGGDSAGTGGVVGQDLADDEHLVPPPGDGFRHDPLRPAIAIQLGGVDQRHAEIEPELERGDLLLRFPRGLAHMPSALPEPRDGFA